jgi:5-methylcytosine-specific restriction endonuclease McrA
VIDARKMIGRGKRCTNPECRKGHTRRGLYCSTECSTWHRNKKRCLPGGCYYLGDTNIPRGKLLDKCHETRRRTDKLYIQSPEGYLKRKESQHNRRARMLAVVGNFSEAQFLELWTNSGGICRYCKKYVQYGTAECTRDHSIPVSFKGSSNDISNIVVACRRCNSSKNATTGSKYIARVYKGKYMERRQQAA